MPAGCRPFRTSIRRSEPRPPSHQISHLSLALQSPTLAPSLHLSLSPSPSSRFQLHSLSPSLTFPLSLPPLFLPTRFVPPLQSSRLHCAFCTLLLDRLQSSHQQSPSHPPTPALCRPAAAASSTHPCTRTPPLNHKLSRARRPSQTTNLSFAIAFSPTLARYQAKASGLLVKYLAQRTITAIAGDYAPLSRPKRPRRLLDTPPRLP
ncbi:uncharacterized protein F5Z01DRAFT_62684 [Emericellopsis atlantica]|uniref:Uncharacterized protein n=1 Tax=Emericellopsis atlantica TaxID=2614577 RepID=A0A9P7ZMQ1_9HYPO|nr:uncharacterized protein F5Z01DRAFT_62684 [Emericellopsis atlantica]KAG9254964.1 hypothetical protein F5Z01DRAFT_62684 [Emericellopsis atlantica]